MNHPSPREVVALPLAAWSTTSPTGRQDAPSSRVTPQGQTYASLGTRPCSQS